MFHRQVVRRTAEAVKAALAGARRVTHFGVGQARVERVASNRRVVTPARQDHLGAGQLQRRHL